MLVDSGERISWKKVLDLATLSEETLGKPGMSMDVPSPGRGEYGVDGDRGVEIPLSFSGYGVVGESREAWGT